MAQAADRFGYDMIGIADTPGNAMDPWVAATLVASYPWFIVWLAFFGAGYAASTPAGGRAILGWFTRGRGFAMGVRQTGVPAGGFLGGLLLPPAAAAFGYRLALVAAAGVSATICLGAAWLYREPPLGEEPQVALRWRDLARGTLAFARDARFVLVMITSMILVSTQGSMNAFVALTVIGLAVALTLGYSTPFVFMGLVAAALVLGVLAVLPIGGADMPVIISLLNSFTGVAVAITGFVLSSNVLIISGTLVGASGTLLTMLMAKAMNRSLGNVLFGAFGAVRATGPGPAAAAASVRTASVEDVATLLAYAPHVIVVPGYGLAVAQAQHAVRELSTSLEKRGVNVRFAIHPVAGRMPGHMNVLLAEANVPYSQLHEMDEINPQFDQADVALVIGANDVTNPAAKTNPSSPIYGMPILDVENSHSVIVIKRSMNPGFAGIENELYYDPKTQMLFGDAKGAVGEITEEVKAL